MYVISRYLNMFSQTKLAHGKFTCGELWYVPALLSDAALSVRLQGI